MNTSLFMDKQIMDLSNSKSKKNSDNDFMDLINDPPQEDHHIDLTTGGRGGAKQEEILPNYDFQPILPLGSSQPSNFDSSGVGGARVRVPAESKSNSGVRNYGSLDSIEPAKVVEKDRAFNAAFIAEVDRTMKKHADNLMHALERVSARLSQLESRSRHLESSLDDLRSSVGNNHGSADGKLRQIENMVREVQDDVQIVKDKQEILEAQLQLSKVQISKVEQRSEKQTPGHMESVEKQLAVSAATQSQNQPPPAAITQSLPPTLPNAPPPPSPQNPTNQFPQNVIPASHHDLYYPPSGQTMETPPQQYQLPPPQQHLQPTQVAAPPSPQPQYQPPSHIQYSQPPPTSQQHPSLTNAIPSQSQLPVGHHPEEPPYLPSQTYPPTVRQPPSTALPHSQQFYGNPSQMYEPPPSSRPGPGFASQYGQGEPYSYGGTPSQYGSESPRKPQQHPATNVGPSDGSRYSQLPTARILPQAIPTASPVGGASGSGNRVPIDDVVDKVTNMGFPRDQVRATVRKLTENGQAVDLNVVLDQLMTDGIESQGPRGWFGR